MAKQFRRIESGKKIAGVCTGLADYFNLDVTLVRVLFVVLLLAGVGSGLVAYIILWLVAPADTEPLTPGSRPPADTEPLTPGSPPPAN